MPYPFHLRAISHALSNLQATVLCARGKMGTTHPSPPLLQLWLQLDSRPWVLFHLGMTGSFAAFHPDGQVESADYVNTKVRAPDQQHWADASACTHAMALGPACAYYYC